MLSEPRSRWPAWYVLCLFAGMAWATVALTALIVWDLFRAL